MMLIGLCLCGFSAYLTLSGNKSAVEIAKVFVNGKKADDSGEKSPHDNLNTQRAQVPPMLD